MIFGLLFSCRFLCNIKKKKENVFFKLNIFRKIVTAAIKSRARTRKINSRARKMVDTLNSRVLLDVC